MTRTTGTLRRGAAVLGVLPLFALACARPTAPGAGPPARFDVILRGGTVLDGTGGGRYRADVGVARGRVVTIGDLSGVRSPVELNVAGLLVAPGFINLHSHANANALPTAENMLTQGVTTELLNPDGGGPPDIGQQLASLEAGGLAVNVGAYTGFNSIWSRTIGPADRRPTAEDIAAMQALIEANLGRGAWGVSAGLDYKPAYFARADEVVKVLEPARRWRTNFTNHDRVTPETNFSSRAGMLETMQIATAAGLMPVITHMKVQGREQGSAGEILDSMRAATMRGSYTAADAYPYLAGQTALAALIIPGWAQEGGRTEMLKRFQDPEQRARIALEAEAAMRARFEGPDGILLPARRQTLQDVMRELQLASAGEAVIRILESESPTAILRFGSEADLVQILRHPTTSIACDCGAARTVTHPRGFGTYPRVLGRYVREQKVLTWEDAIRKMTGLPAATIGMVDRGFLAPGMAADIVVLDSAAVLDRATYEDPTARSEGIRHVLVNGRVVLRDGTATGEKPGRALYRSRWMPSRPMTAAVDRRVVLNDTVSALGTDGSAGADVVVHLDVSQPAAAARATGSFRLVNRQGGAVVEATELGLLQLATGWATFTGMARVQPAGEERAVSVIIEAVEPSMPAGGVIVVDVDGMPGWHGRFDRGRLTLTRGTASTR